MLSKFDLKPEANFAAFKKDYSRFIEVICELNLIESAGPIGQRVKNSPMDTAGDDEPEFYSIMSFKDRTQLDAAYEHLLAALASQDVTQVHHQIHKSITNDTFTCWQDDE